MICSHCGKNKEEKEITYYRSIKTKGVQQYCYTCLKQIGVYQNIPNDKTLIGLTIE